MVSLKKVEDTSYVLTRITKINSIITFLFIVKTVTDSKARCRRCQIRWALNSLSYSRMEIMPLERIRYHHEHEYSSEILYGSSDGFPSAIQSWTTTWHMAKPCKIRFIAYTIFHPNIQQPNASKHYNIEVHGNIWRYILTLTKEQPCSDDNS